MWFSIDAGSSSTGFKFYGGETEILKITGDGKIHLIAGGDIVDSNGTSLLGGGGGTGALDLQPVPSTNKGQAGDTKGMIAINGSEFYFCSDNYTDGVNPIWFKFNGSSAW
jgi:hypothetical protein